MALLFACERREQAASPLKGGREGGDQFSRERRRGPCAPCKGKAGVLCRPSVACLARIARGVTARTHTSSLRNAKRHGSLLMIQNIQRAATLQKVNCELN